MLLEILPAFFTAAGNLRCPRRENRRRYLGTLREEDGHVQVLRGAEEDAGGVSGI